MGDNDYSFGEKVDQAFYKMGYKLGKAVAKHSGGSDGGSKPRSNRTKFDYVFFGNFPQWIKEEEVTIGECVGNGLYRGSDGKIYCERRATDGGVFAGDFTYAAAWHTSLANTSVGRYTNGQRQGQYFQVQPIKWYVVDESGDTLTLLSARVLFYTPFMARHSFGQSGGAWSNSDLRKVLNGEFYQTAFTEEERECILFSLVHTETKGYSIVEKINGGDTSDKVFILSREEIASYGLQSDDLSKFQSDFVGYYTDFLDPDSPTHFYANWATRSPFGRSENKGSASLYFVTGAGSISSSDLSLCGVVPVIRVPKSAVTVYNGRPAASPVDAAAAAKAAEQKLKEEQARIAAKKKEEEELNSPPTVGKKVVATIIAIALWFLGEFLGCAFSPHGSAGNLGSLIVIAYLVFTIVIIWKTKSYGYVLAITPTNLIVSFVICLILGIVGAPF